MHNLHQYMVIYTPGEGGGVGVGGGGESGHWGDVLHRVVLISAYFSLFILDLL